jgi:hypothetical protein
VLHFSCITVTEALRKQRFFISLSRTGKSAGSIYISQSGLVTSFGATFLDYGVPTICYPLVFALVVSLRRLLRGPWCQEQCSDTG